MENNNNSSNSEYSELMGAAVGIAEQIDALLLQMQQLREKAERDRSEIKKLKADFQSTKTEQMDYIKKSLEEGLSRIETNVYNTVIQEMNEKDKSKSSSKTVSKKDYSD